MPSPVAVLPALVLLLAVAPAAPVPEGKKGTYYATKVGAKWTYHTTSTQKTGTVTGKDTVQVTAVEAKGEAVIVTVGRENAGGKTPPTKAAKKVAVSGAGLTLVASEVRDLDPPRVILKLSARAGGTWSWYWKDPATAGRALRTTYTARGEEEGTVPTGACKTLRVDSVIVLGDAPPFRTSEWYAEWVGLVKLTSKHGSNEQVQVLRSFSPGED